MSLPIIHLINYELKHDTMVKGFIISKHDAISIKY